jgi:hypothetical protein
MNELINNYKGITIMSELLSWNSSSDIAELNVIKNWITNFLCAPHPDLGRSGEVCPFTREAIQKDSIFFTVETSSTLENDKEIKKLTEQITVFKELETNNAEKYKVIINAYPNISADDYVNIEQIQKQLKPLFVDQCLMIGQFYPGCREKGLWNDQFFPLDSPEPFLAIRHMAITDIAFLMSNETFLNKYLQVFGGKGEAFYVKFMEYAK